MSNATKRINAARIDGRAQSPRYIQQQLLRLHEVLVENAKDIRDAIRSDSHHTSGEIEVEYYLALQTVKDQYLQLNVERLIEEEYNLANSIDSPCRMIAAGVVYISPADYTRLYSIIAPLSAAISAGNCVVVEVSQAPHIVLNETMADTSAVKADIIRTKCASTQAFAEGLGLGHIRGSGDYTRQPGSDLGEMYPRSWRPER
jgi:acyl-CoA reductase-like NAD-dependent aldehyde dehydrogenase